MARPLPDPVLRALRAVVGHEHVVDDPDVVATHVVDWTGAFAGSSPAVVRPASTGEVAEVVALCRREGIALVPQGGNTGLVGGGVPLAGEVVLSTTRLVGVSDVDADAGQLTARAGTTLAAVQAAAATAGWRYGVDLAARDSATIGGTVATNAGGLRVMRHGTTRRQVLGVEAVLGTGDVVSRLGGLVKDNTGYDLAGLLCGSEGTLGVITRTRLALVPAGEGAVTALVGLRSVADALAVVGRLRRAVPTLEAAEVVLDAGARLVAEQTGARPVLDPVPPVQLVVEAVGPPDPSPTLAAVLASSPEVTDVAVAEDVGRAARLWHVREAHTEAIARLGAVRKYDVTLPGPAIARFVDEVAGLVREVEPAADVWVFGHLGDGNLHVNVTGGPGPGHGAPGPAGAGGAGEWVGSAGVGRAGGGSVAAGMPPDGDAAAPPPGDPIADVVLARVVAAGGSISAEHGIGTAKRSWLHRDRGPGDLAAMRAVKAALDPDGIMNPAVLLG